MAALSEFFKAEQAAIQALSRSFVWTMSRFGGVDEDAAVANGAVGAVHE